MSGMKRLLITVIGPTCSGHGFESYADAIRYLAAGE